MLWVRNLRRFIGSGAGLGSEALMGPLSLSLTHTHTYTHIFHFLVKNLLKIPFFLFLGLAFTSVKVFIYVNVFNTLICICIHTYIQFV